MTESPDGGPHSDGPLADPLAPALRAIVLVGTDMHPFDRLVDWIHRYPSVAEITWTVQYGTSRASHLPGGTAFLDRPTLAGRLAGADIVVCHGGPATIAEARRAGHVPLVVPRDPALGEHVDGHQQRFARRLARSGLIELCETEGALRVALDRARANPDRFRAAPHEADAAVTTSALRVGEIADALVAGGRPGRLPRQLRRQPAMAADDAATRAPSPGRPAPAAPSRRGVAMPPRQRTASDVGGSPTDPARHPTDGGRTAVRVLFIGGWGRSGSTLTERLLGEMPEMVGAGEVTHLWLRALRDNERCACGAAFRECPFWSKVGDYAFDGWTSIDVQDVLRLKQRVDRTRFVGRLALPDRLTRRRADLARYTDYHRRVYAAVAAVAGADVVIDSSKHASLAFALRHQPGIDLRVLHLVRDARGVAYSWSKEVVRPEATGTDTLMPQYSAVKSGLLWLAHNGLFHLLRGRVRRMRYEDLIADPVAGLAAIRAFAGLPPQAADFVERIDGSYVARLGTAHSIAGNPMRFTSGTLTLRQDRAWRAAMPPGKRRLVSILTWPGRVRYGYLDRGGDR